jgi:hypothetical protein
MVDITPRIITYVQSAVPPSHGPRAGWRHFNLPAYEAAIALLISLRLAEESWFGAWALPGTEPIENPNVGIDATQTMLVDLAATVHDLEFRTVPGRRNILIPATGQIPPAVMANHALLVFEQAGLHHEGVWTSCGIRAILRARPLSFLLACLEHRSRGTQD